MSKSTLVYFLLVAGFIGFFYWLGRREKPLGPVPVVQATPAPTTAPPPPPPPAAPARPAAATQFSSMLDNEKVQRLARQARVEVIRFDIRGTAAILEVRWVSDVVTQGAEFADLLRIEGMIRAYDSGDPPLRAEMTPDGRRAFVAVFKVIF